MSNSSLTVFINSERTELTNSFTLEVIFSNEPPVVSNNKAISFVNSVWELIKSSSVLPSSPALFFTSSKFVEISFNVLIYFKPASSPGPPNISAMAVPTAAELSGSSFNFSETSCITSKVVIDSLCNSFCIFFEFSPIPSSAAAVESVISRSRMFASLIVSIPLSENMPCLLVSAMMATNWSADIPASLKYAGYSFKLSKNSPFASAPAINPSLTTCNALSEVIPNCFDMVLAEISTSLKSFP